MRPFYLLDTNVISELAKPKPDKKIERLFFEKLNRSAVPSVVWGECLYGLKRIPHSKRRDNLTEFYMNRVLDSIPFIPFDEHAAAIYSDIKARLLSIGKPAPEMDMMIASIAIANNMILITRNVSDFSNIQTISALMLENWFTIPKPLQADPSKIPPEKSAWAEAVVEK